VNVVVNLILVCAVIILLPLALAMLLVSGVAVVTAARDGMSRRRMRRHIDELIGDRS
jgi:hypothetical protein